MEDYLSEEEIDALEYKLLVEWLETVPTMEWHVLAHEWNYDMSHDILRWIADNPRTEKATALLLYWTGAPRYHKQYATVEEAKANYVEADWLFIHDIEAKYLAGFYTGEVVGFDPANDNYTGFIGMDWTSNYKDKTAALEIPAAMFKAVPGVHPSSTIEYPNGMPEHIYNQLEPLWGDSDDEDE